jgi:hypothetical protein
LLRARTDEATILQVVKNEASFSGARMRSNILRMLRHFHFADILGIADEEDLWGTAAGLLHCTSVVPNAAFKNGKMFSGRFQEILKVSLLRQQFEEDFVRSLTRLPPDAMYIALGKTPFDALLHCVGLGVIAQRQLLGAFTHPSGSGGSQVDVYLRKTPPTELDPKDPVRNRLPWLRDAYDGMRLATDRLRGSRIIAASPPLLKEISQSVSTVKARIPGLAMSVQRSRRSPSNSIIAMSSNASACLSPPDINARILIATQGSLNNHYIRVIGFVDLFELDTIGGGNKQSVAARQVTMEWGGQPGMETDIDGVKKSLRNRTLVRQFMHDSGLVAGDRVEITRVSPYRYRLRRLVSS